MIQTYWDTSALIKLYAPEPDSAFWKEQAGDIRRVDAVRAMRRFTADCSEGRIIKLPCNNETASLAQDMVDFASGGRKPVMLRSLDAIHLASAQAIRAAGVVTTDMRMRDIAAVLRLKLIPGK